MTTFRNVLQTRWSQLMTSGAGPGPVGATSIWTYRRTQSRWGPRDCTSTLRTFSMATRFWVSHSQGLYAYKCFLAPHVDYIPPPPKTNFSSFRIWTETLQMFPNSYKLFLTTHLDCTLTKTSSLSNKFFRSSQGLYPYVYFLTPNLNCTLTYTSSLRIWIVPL
jgi:hypothetical protein